jgi:ribonuclease HI
VSSTSDVSAWVSPVTHPALGRERHLLDPAVRADPVALDSLLHADFTEVGASGRHWSRAEIIGALVADPAISGEMSNASAAELAYGIALVTYDFGDTRRSSVWVREYSRWLLRYHQGTRLA